MQKEAYAQSDIGRRRQENQDAFLIDDDLGLYIVCDGMGGHAAGDVASSHAIRITADIVRRQCHSIREALDRPDGRSAAIRIATETVRETCQQLYFMATNDPELAGMGTTLTMLLTVQDKALLAHVGDSRLYLLRGRKLHQLTHDHTLANELIQTGRIAHDSPDVARFSHVLTRSVGSHESVDVETLLFDLLPGDRFLMCSDGLSNYFENDREIVSLLSLENLKHVPVALTDLANDRGGNDNITCVVVSISAKTSKSAEEFQASLDALKPTFLCRGLTLAQRMRVAGAGHVQRFPAGECIVKKGDQRSGIYVVINGSCVITSETGSTATLAPGQCFGEMALACRDRYRIHVEATEPIAVFHLPRDQFRRIVRQFPKLGRRLLDNLLAHLSRKYDEMPDSGDVSPNSGRRIPENDPSAE